RAAAGRRLAPPWPRNPAAAWAPSAPAASSTAQAGARSFAEKARKSVYRPFESIKPAHKQAKENSPEILMQAQMYTPEALQSEALVRNCFRMVAYGLASPDLLDRYGARAAELSAGMKPSQFSVLLNSFARAEHRHEQMLRSFTRRMPPRLPRFVPKDISQVCHAYSKLRERDEAHRSAPTISRKLNAWKELEHHQHLQPDFRRHSSSQAGVAAALHGGACEHGDVDLAELYRLGECLCRGSGQTTFGGRGTGKGKGKEFQQMTKQFRAFIARIVPITWAESCSMPWAAVYEEPPTEPTAVKEFKTRIYKRMDSLASLATAAREADKANDGIIAELACLKFMVQSTDKMTFKLTVNGLELECHFSVFQSHTIKGMVSTCHMGLGQAWALRPRHSQRRLLLQGIPPTQPFMPFTAEEDPALQGPPSVTDLKGKTVIDVKESQSSQMTPSQVAEAVRAIEKAHRATGSEPASHAASSAAGGVSNGQAMAAPLGPDTASPPRKQARGTA
ncbi:unnamed protein product, partial [Prorocentrum cordatum]